MNSLFDPDGPTDKNASSADSSSIFASAYDETNEADEEPFILSETQPQSVGETVRQSGLAYSAGIVLFASVAFMLVIGWGADLLLGTSPWGIVGGIIIGGLVGFFQFFRITSQIFKK